MIQRSYITMLTENLLLEKKHKKNQPQQGGFAALLTIVIVAAATLIMAYNASVLGLGELDDSYTSQRGNDALAIATGCMEEAHRQVRIDASYTGSTITTNRGSCIITRTIDGSVSTTTVLANTTDNYYKKVQSVIRFTDGALAVQSWQEVTD